MGLLIIYSMQLGEGVGGSLTQWHKAKGLQVLQILKFPKMALYFSLVNFIQKKLSKKSYRQISCVINILVPHERKLVIGKAS